MVFFLYVCAPCTFLAEHRICTLIRIALVTRPTQSSLTRSLISSVLGRWICLPGCLHRTLTLFLSRCCWWARQARLPPCSFLQSCLLHPASSEDRALAKMLRRAEGFAAAVCVPAATSSYKKVLRDVWQRSGMRELETLDCFHTVTQTPLLQEPLPSSLAGGGGPSLSHWMGGGIHCLSHWAQSLALSQALCFLPLCQRLLAHNHNNDGLSQYSLHTGENKCK